MVLQRVHRQFYCERRSHRPTARNADRFAYSRRGEVVSLAYSNGTLVVSNRYDHLGRRVQKITADSAHTFLYDAWRPVLETVSRPGGTDRIEYHWGKDLSGTLDGAAGGCGRDVFSL